MDSAPEQKVDSAPEQKVDSTPEQKVDSTPEQKVDSTPEQKVSRFINQLGHDQQDVFLKAQQELIEIGSPATDQLICILEKEKTNVCRRAVQCLSKIGNESAFDSLKSILEDRDRDYDLRLGAARGLGNIKTQVSVDCLIQVLESEGWEGSVFTVQGACISSLGKLGDPKAIDPIGQFIDDRDVKNEALEALGNFKESKAQNLIITALNGELFYDDMMTAIKALSNSSGETVLNALVTTLEGYSDFSIDPRVKLLDAINRIATHDMEKSYYLNFTGRLIDYFFENVNSDPICDHIASSDEKEFENLFGDFTPLIFDSASFYSKRFESGGSNHERFCYDATDSLRAIKFLCKINSPISTNLLHKISGKHDVSVVKQISGNFVTKETFSLEEHRCLAKEELQRRGMPAYDASAYLNFNNWIIAE